MRHLSGHPLFRRLGEDEKQSDPVVEKLFESSEEGQKVSLTGNINNLNTLVSCFSGEQKQWPEVVRRVRENPGPGTVMNTS